MKRVSLLLIMLIAVASFGGSFSCHSGDVNVHSDPHDPQQPNR